METIIVVINLRRKQVVEELLDKQGTTEHI